MKGQSLILVALLLASSLARAGEVEVQKDIEHNRLVVEALGKDGQILRNGIGFLWDQGRIVCSYSTIRGADTIRVMSSEWANQMNRLVSYSEDMDVAVLQTDGETPDLSPLGSSDMLVAGDSVFYYSRGKTGWHLNAASVKNWADSGKGYETIALGAVAAAERGTRWEPSPLYNAAGKIVGWIPKSAAAIPLDSLGGLLSEKSATVLLPEASSRSEFWRMKLLESVAAPDENPVFSTFHTVSGPAAFRFRIGLPLNWPTNMVSEASRFILRSSDVKFGISAELRVMTQSTGDLVMGAESIETLMFPGMPREYIEPYSVDHFTGLRAKYHDDKRTIHAFYAGSGKNIYVLAVSSPAAYASKIEPLIEQIFSSMEL